MNSLLSYVSIIISEIVAKATNSKKLSLSILDIFSPNISSANLKVTPALAYSLKKDSSAFCLGLTIMSASGNLSPTSLW